MDPVRQAWLAAHPYLAQVAEFQALVEEAAAGARTAPPATFEPCRPDLARGIPLLRSEAAGVDPRPAAAEALGRIVERLAGAALPPALAQGAAGLRERFARVPAERTAALQRALAGGGEGEGEDPAGLERYLAWSALATALAAVVEAFDRWRDDAAWGRPECPTCGALPVMAQLVAADAGRERRLACGRCRSRWRFRRIGCPYCANDRPERIDVFEVSGEDGLRLDVCRECSGYVKTVAREDPPAFLLADWSTVHLDALAREQGYARRGASLYDL
ncbi:MAG TPA: formate dehydrogenase accessory protein FdhE [Anaeromyxobacter sp.]|nr:formate dehydrogenase accessory protein FdhE [Anaeromyxobacter sp.]